MPFVFKRLALFMSIAAAFAADKDTPFKANPASSYAHKQTSQNLTIAAEPYTGTEQAKSAFGKVNPYEWGVLPVLVVIQNDSDQTIRVDRLRVTYTGPKGTNTVEATPARDIRYLKPPSKPTMIPGPTGPKVIRLKKNPLDAWEIEGRAFSAQMLPPGNSASGFFYFQTGLQPDSTITISGITEAKTGKELLFFEIPLK